VQGRRRRIRCGLPRSLVEVRFDIGNVYVVLVISQRLQFAQEFVFVDRHATRVQKVVGAQRVLALCFVVASVAFAATVMLARTSPSIR